jgi:hypothetical protein
MKENISRRSVVREKLSGEQLSLGSKCRGSNCLGSNSHGFKLYPEIKKYKQIKIEYFAEMLSM